MKKQQLVCTLMILVLAVFAKVGHAQSPLDKVIAPLTRWAETQPQEKVYLHTDKPYYIAGDTIWLKAYTVIGARNLLSALSGALYIDLINESDSLISAIKLPLMAGMGKGNIDLPNDLGQGNYRLRAYTQWMRNAGSDYFYDQSFKIGSISKKLSNAQIAFDYEAEKQQEQVRTLISYRDSNDEPLINKPVDYQIQSSTGLLKRGKAKTDEKGNITLTLKSTKAADSVNTHIVSHIEAEKNKWEKHSFPVKATFNKTDIQFFPEGGNLVAGLPSRVGFKAVGQDGLGVPVNGVILNQEQEETAVFSSIHAGMGVFTITPENGQTYQAEISFPDGRTERVQLPKVESEGYVLAVYPQAERDSLLVRVMSSSNRYKPVSLVVQQAGEVLYAADFTINKILTTLHIPTIDFVSGVVQFTLFNALGQAINERIAFIERPDQLQLAVDFDVQNQKIRHPVNATVTAKDAQGVPASGNFSIAVLDETQVPVPEDAENSILAQLLLKSEIKGYIENPTYYFTEVDNEKRDQLDALMMTQGYRRFSWDKLINGEMREPEFPAEKITSTISGRLVSLLGKPVENGRITLVSLAANVVLDTITNREGYFEFPNLLLTDSIKFTIQGRSAKNSDKVEILLDGVPGMRITQNKNIGDASFDIQRDMHQYIDNSIQRDETLRGLGLSSRVILLDQVNVTGNRSKLGSSNLNGSGRADQVISANELSACPTLKMCLDGRLHGIRFQTEQTSIGPVSFPVSTRGNGKLLIAIDSRILRPDQESDLMDIAGLFEQNMIDPSDIRNIEVLRSPTLIATYGQDAQNGVIIINTNGWVPGTRTDFSIRTYAPKGFSNVREFYSPQYTVEPSLPDLRSTIYWNPTLLTDENGKGSVSFFNSTRPAGYRIVLEGVSNEGKIGRKVIHYKVTE